VPEKFQGIAGKPEGVQRIAQEEVQHQKMSVKVM
jgi:hypothetical protein